MTLMLDDRKRAILSAVIEDFIYSAEPVGSQRLVDKYNLSVSSATVRNELSILEELGYLSHPHTSAGRVPTDQGYRYYVDTLTPGGAEQLTEMNGFSALEPARPGDLMRETSQFLANTTQTMAVVYAPDIKRERVKHVDLIALSSVNVMIVIILSDGSISKQVLEIAREVPQETLSRLQKRLNEALNGKLVEEIVRSPLATEDLPEAERELFGGISTAVIDSLSAGLSDRVYHDGAAQLLEYSELADLDEMRRVLALIEHNYIVFEWLRAATEAGGLVVSIGDENRFELVGYTVIASGYAVRGESAGALGVIGPTRMDYRRTIAAVRQIAEQLGKALEELES